jgi:hypothetical protein
MRCWAPSCRSRSIPSRDDACPRRLQLGASFGVGDRRGHQIGEITDARLGFGGHGFLTRRADDQRAPRRAVHGDGCPDTGAQPESAQTRDEGSVDVGVVVDPRAVAGAPNPDANAIAVERNMLSHFDLHTIQGVLRGQHDEVV